MPHPKAPSPAPQNNQPTVQHKRTGGVGMQTVGLSNAKRPASEPPDPIAVAHYNLAAPLIAKHFEGMPLVWACYPPKLRGAAQWHAHYFGHITRFTQDHVRDLAAIGAQEFYSWFSTPQDDQRGEFARFVLAAQGQSAAVQLREAATLVRSALQEEERDSFCVLDGTGGIHIWVPIAGAPLLSDILAWTRAAAKRIVAKHPDKLSEQPNTAHDGLVHIHHTHNAYNTWTIAPYSYRATTGRIATPVHWEEMPTIDLLGIPVDRFAARLEYFGDVFADELTASAPKPVPQTPQQMYGRATGNKRGMLIQAAVNILSDGKPRTADQILVEALAQHSIANTSVNVLYVSLISYITRCQGRGRKPAIVEDPGMIFRLNEPLDAWPPVPPQPLRTLTKEQQEIVDRLNATSTGENPDEFEVAVCDTFRALNFIATHIGGRANPDAYVDAQLGALGYRAMIECKSGTAVHGPNVFEAAKYKDTYNAKYCALVGPDFGDQVEIIQECKNHGVSAWTIDDLETLLKIGADGIEMEALFQPGVIAADALEDLMWERNHGRTKHVRIVAEIIRSAGWDSQCAAAQSGTPADAPVLTEDAAMLLVDQELRAQKAQVSCSRQDVRDAFAYLTHPLVRAATTMGNGLVITAP